MRRICTGITMFLLIGFMTVANAAPIPAWNGNWATNWGRLIMIQTGNELAGIYDYNGGKVEGVVLGSVVKGRWTEKDRSGEFEFHLASDGKSFTGTYRSRNSCGDWSGVKQ